MTRVLVLNGPNLGRLGSREPEVYGSTTHSQLVAACQRAGRELGLDVDVRQTDDETELVHWLHEAADAHVPVILNPAAFTHYSYAVRDACAQLTAPLVEVHLSNPAAREQFRHRSVVADVAAGTIAGFGVESYLLALRAVVGLAARPRLRIRPAAPDDVPAALEVFALAEGARRGARVDHDEVDAIGSRMRAAGWPMVACHAGGVVGMAVGFHGRADDGAGEPIPGLAHLSLVMVRPEDWGAGVGGALVDAMLVQASERGFRRIQLWTHENNERSHRLYRSRGFTHSGRTKERDHGGQIIGLWVRDL